MNFYTFFILFFFENTQKTNKNEKLVHTEL